MKGRGNVVLECLKGVLGGVYKGPISVGNDMNE